MLGLIDIDQGGTVTYTRHGEALQVSLEDLRPEHSMKTEAGFLLSGKEESIAAQVEPGLDRPRRDVPNGVAKTNTKKLSQPLKLALYLATRARLTTGSGCWILPTARSRPIMWSWSSTCAFHRSRDALNQRE